MSNAIYYFIGSAIHTCMQSWRQCWPNESVPPKFHFLEDHVLDFITEWKVGLGFYGEQGMFMNIHVLHQFVCKTCSYSVCSELECIHINTTIFSCSQKSNLCQ